MLRIRILTENLVRRRGLLAEHGLSFWIQSGEDKVLFDVGQTDVYLHNAGHLGIDVSLAHAVILSHGHYDHVGGLAHFPKASGWPRVFIHPDAFAPKFSKTDDPRSPYKSIGIPWQKEELAGLEKRLVYNTSTRQVGERMHILTEISKNTDYETPAVELVAEKNGQMILDDFHDEQVLVCQCEQGLVVMLGCGHPGVVNCLQYVRQVFANQPIYSVIGGMHLEKADENRLTQTMDYLQKQPIAKIIPLHCTGQNVIRRMKATLGDRVLIHSTGDKITVD